ncbi:protein of unknown function [Acidithiobacillus ferrivorans]|uniref:Uncharacterized protein n=1 Tax=Acidithiobacillus ferrivorans TaxID=160808 RepID=A0ABY1MSP4_9PROT|nr:protein of unknown function [Acidithiobacillus ferrivorans]
MSKRPTTTATPAWPMVNHAREWSGSIRYEPAGLASSRWYVAASASDTSDADNATERMVVLSAIETLFGNMAMLLYQFGRNGHSTARLLCVPSQKGRLAE